jgi:hypothetical protein
MELKIDLASMIEDLDDDHMGYPYDNHMGGHELTDTITLNSVADTITLSSPNYSNTVVGGGLSYPNVTMASSGVYTTTGTSPYTISGGAGVNPSPWATYTGAPKIQLNGEGADIELNGWSLIESFKKIEERLNILTPNTKLEEEWEELRALGNQYRELEQHIKDKQATWDKLKAMPPPSIE